MKIRLYFAALAVATVLPLTACGSTADEVAASEAASTSTAAASEAATASTTSMASPEAEASEGARGVESLPFNAGGLLGGNTSPDLPDGEPDEVSVIQIASLDTSNGTMPIAFRNNTAEGISHVDWTATARRGGKIVATGSSQGTIPAQVQPGEVGLSYIYFENSEAIPDKSEYTFTVETSPLDKSSYNTAPLKVTEASISGEAIVGSASNETGASTEGPYSVSIYCFKGDKILRQTNTFAEQDGPIEDGEEVTFSADLFGEKCKSFVVGVGGYFS